MNLALAKQMLLWRLKGRRSLRCLGCLRWLDWLGWLAWEASGIDTFAMACLLGCFRYLDWLAGLAWLADRLAARVFHTRYQPNVPPLGPVAQLRELQVPISNLASTMPR